jgi:cyclopropane-fatty-acyl-phospholipid synthase
MHDQTLASASHAPDRHEPAPGRPALMLRIADALMRRNGIGRLHLTLPSGASATIGTGTGAASAAVALRSWHALWRLYRRGALGFAEAYMDGDIDTDDLSAVFGLYLANARALARVVPGIDDTRPADRSFHKSRANTRAGSRRNIADHYDLGNAFYRLWLDDSMLYSSGIHADRTTTLEAAQAAKVSRVVEALELEAGARVLEIGCGWGAVAQAIAANGARVHAITLSSEQLAAARDRIAAAGLADRVDIRLEDYRETTGQFDRIVSIEMIEAVGEENWPVFFETLSARLKPGGTAVIQAITIRDDAFAQYRANPDFIQRYVFPGGMLPTVELMDRRAGEAGLAFETVERFGASYALTLADWRRRFEAAWPQIEALGFDERFRRLWRYYLIYCEVGFEIGHIDVGLYRLRKPA